MKKISLILLLAIVMIISSCNTLSVTSDYDKTVDFTQFKTYSYYGWADNSDKILTPFDKERIEKAFASEFNNRGLTFQKEGGDLVVALYIVTEQKQQTTATTTGMGGIVWRLWWLLWSMVLAGAGVVECQLLPIIPMIILLEHLFVMCFMQVTRN